MKNLEKKGYRFAGWYTDENRIRPARLDDQQSRQVILYDKWVPVEYPVRYLCPYGINNRRNPKQINIESGIRKLFPPIQKEKFFAGWFWKGKRIDFLPEGITEPVELEAVFLDEPPKMHFYPGNSQNLPDLQLNMDGSVPENLPVPMRIGCDFAGWYADEECRKPFDFRQKYYEDVKCYAAWKNTEYEIHYDLQGGYFEEEPERNFTYNSADLALSRPLKAYSRFEGWQDFRGRIIEVIPAGTIGSIRLKAIWRSVEPEVHVMKKKNS